MDDGWLIDFGVCNSIQLNRKATFFFELWWQMMHTIFDEALNGNEIVTHFMENDVGLQWNAVRKTLSQFSNIPL